jgi:energy-coupling factor transport system permease protein
MGLGTPSFFYRRLASPLHAARAGVGAVWALALTAAALVLFHPLVLLALVLAVLVAGVAAGVGRLLARTLRTAAIVAVPIVAVNVLVSREGLTVLARLGDLGPFGQGNLTLEAFVYGAVIALKLGLLIFVTTLASVTVDPDELLRGLRRLSFRFALTASLATRMIPLLAADAQRIAEAQRTRPEGAPSGARARVALLGAIVAGSLDRAMDVAATLELRGLAARGGAARPRGAPGSSRPPSASRWAGRSLARRGNRRERVIRVRPWSRHDIAFLLSAAAVLALALAGRLAGAASFRAYPLLKAPVGVGTLALCAALILAVLLPLCDRRGIEP